MKNLIGLFALLILSSCADNRFGVLTVNDDNRGPEAVEALTSMSDTGDNYTFYLGANGGSYTQSIPGIFELRSGFGANPFEGNLNGSNGVSGTNRLGGKSFLGFPVDLGVTRAITATSSISFSNQRILGSNASIYINLIIDSDCNGIFNSANDAIVAFAANINSNFSLQQSSILSGVYGGAIPGIAQGMPFSKLSGMCLINTILLDNGMPANKKMAGIMIVVGDSTKNANSDATFQVSNLDIRM